MKLLFLTSLFITLTIIYGSGQTIRKSIIKSNIQGLENDTVFVLYSPLSGNHDLKRDTLVAKNNTFTYQIHLKEPALLALIPKKGFYKRIGGGYYVEQTKFIELFVRPADKINITGKLVNNYLDYFATGSEINKTLSLFRNTYRNSAIKAVNIELKIDSLENVKGNNDRVKQLFHERGIYFNNILKSKIKFVNKHLDNDLSAYFICRFPLKAFESYYSKLTTKVKNGMFKSMLESEYQNYLNFMVANKAKKELKAGSTAPGFTLKSYDGGQISLSTFKGKIIVLDFWGTWCPPCMQELPKIKSLHEKYGSKIKFIGIACNEPENNWKNAISKNKLNWLQLLNSKENDVSILYGIEAFPTKIVIGKDFKILGRYVGINDDFYRLIKKLVE